MDGRTRVDAATSTRRSPLLPLAALLVGTAIFFSGLTAAVLMAAADGEDRPPPATRASVITVPVGPPLPPPTTAPAPAPEPAGSTEAVAPAPPPVPAPTGVAIPAIKVWAPVDPMGLTPKGELEAPKRYERVGWWAGGHKPGEQGPAVLEGHVDSTKGPAVFYGLHRLKPGDEIVVLHGEQSSAVFTVDRIASYPKDRFPSLEVYGPTDTPTLRLITCAGAFNRSRGSYRDNLVVYATLR